MQSSKPISHDGRLVNLLPVLHTQARQLADRLTLYRRGAEVVYANSLKDGQWVRPPEAAQALEREHRRPMSVREAQDYAQGFETIAAQMKRPERQASAAEMKALHALQTAARRGLAAAVFRDVPPVEGAKRHPELAGAYAAMAAIERKLESEELNPAARAIVKQRMRDDIEAKIERGEKITIRIKLQQDHDREPDR